MYVLHDPDKQKTRDRVTWVIGQNLHSDLDNVWFEMFETWRSQAQLKANAGLSARGRKNTAPVLHYTLAWHEDDRPTPEEMKEAALASLRVLGLEEHEALIAAHSDKKHPHVHIVANTVHPYTGRTAALKFSKERLSEWAEAYERERGTIRCEERVRNNEQRREIRERREAERVLMAAGGEAAAAMPYLPVKDQSPSRPEWIDQKAIEDRLAKLKGALEQDHVLDREATKHRQAQEQAGLKQSSQDAARHARAHAKERFRPDWRSLYRAQAIERRTVERTATHPLERAVYVFRNRDRLGNGKTLTFRQMAGLILSGKKLSQAVGAMQRREREDLARAAKAYLNERLDRVWMGHAERLDAMRARHEAERASEQQHHKAAERELGPIRARDDILREFDAFLAERSAKRAGPVQTANEFNHAAWSPAPIPFEQLQDRADRIRHDMEAWRRRHPDRDFGMEM